MVLCRTIYSEAFEKVQQDPNVSYLLGSPMKAYGVGGNRGRRNEMERWELTETNGDEVSVVRFTVAGPQGAGIVQTQVPRGRRRGEFNYIAFEYRRKLLMILDNRADKTAAVAQQDAKDDTLPPPPPPSSSTAAAAA